MAMLLSVVLTLGFAYWFYRTAQRVGVNSMQWALVGAFSYQLPAWAWMITVSKPYVSAIQGTANRASMSSGLMGHSWLLVGLVCALLVYRFALLRSNVKS